MNDEPKSPSIIGWYVHDHGSGHRNRAQAIIRHLTGSVDVLTSGSTRGFDVLPAVDQIIELEPDTEVTPSGFDRRTDVTAFHYAPLESRSITRRVHQLTGWMTERNPAVLLVDVSVEVTLLARLAAVPTVVMRQHGLRDDLPHRFAYESAECLFAPFPEAMEDPETPDRVRVKTVYTAGFCRFAEAPPARSSARDRLGWDNDERIVVSFRGVGGTGSPLADLFEAARITPDWTWVVLGPPPRDGDGSDAASLPPNVRLAGWIDDPRDHLAAADVIVSAAGHNSMMEIGAMRGHLIAVAEPRPFDEQVRKARVLDRLGLAVGLETWPENPKDWPGLLDRAASLSVDRWDALVSPDGASHLACELQRIADRFGSPTPSPPFP